MKPALQSAYLIGLAAGWLAQAALAADAPRPNVLFIAADDLRCDLGCYGHPLAKTPHLDRLAARGMRFDLACAQQALCNPSRTSLLTGLRPDRLRSWNLSNHFREVRPNLVTLPQYFQQHGWHTRNIGKIFHNFRTAIEGDPQSWSVPAVMHFASHGQDKPQVDGPLPPNRATDVKCQRRDVPDEAYFDGRIAALAVEALAELAERRQPFFLAVGFWKPHSPFNAPARYWDLYDPVRILTPPNLTPPRGVPELALHNSREVLGTPPRTLSDAAAREIRHGYLAAISYLDAQVGRVLDALEANGLADNTVVVFWSDHGYHLGENSLWAKTSNFELDARVPLIIAAPRMAHPGSSAAAPVELLDLYPTLVDMAGLPTRDDLDGVSLAPLLADPQARVKPAAFSQHPRPAYYDQQPDAMGYSARTETYRYTEWRAWGTGQVVARELYDHGTDPRETVNQAGNPEYAEAVAEGARLIETIQPHVRP